MPLKLPNSNFGPPNFNPSYLSTVTPNQVILVPKLSETHPLSLKAILILMIGVIVCLSVRRIHFGVDE
jgi:hypothetical protein